MFKNKKYPNDKMPSEELDKNKIERVSEKIENIRIAEHMEMVSNPKKIIYMNFVAGLARGLGMGIGFTVLAGIVIYLLRSWVNLPFIGKIVADLLDIIDGYR